MILAPIYCSSNRRRERAGKDRNHAILIFLFLSLGGNRHASAAITSNSPPNWCAALRTDMTSSLEDCAD